jgi:hypothetical protein
MKLFDDVLATLEFRLAWEQDGIRHRDCQHAQRVNFWRDILPPPPLVDAMHRQPGGDTFEFDLEPGAVLPRRSESGIVHVRPGADVLDLLGSWASHLPESLPLNSLTVLGMNGEELAANPRATERVVHDLNRDPTLPFGEGVSMRWSARSRWST